MSNLFISPSVLNNLILNSVNSNIIIKTSVPDSNLLFARPSSTDIIYMSEDNGITWEEITYLIDNNISVYQGRYLYVNPDNTDHMVASFYEVYSSAGPHTILWSNDKGKTWDHISRSGYTGDIVINNTGQYINNFIWGTPYRMQVSSDGGGSWSSNDKNAPRGFASSDGKYVYASIDNSSLQVSHDYGATWLTTNSLSMRSLVFCSRDGKYGIQGQYSGSNVQVSQDYGLTWQSHTSPAGSGSVIIHISTTGQYMSYHHSILSNGAIKVSQDFGNTFFEPLIDGNVNANLNRIGDEYNGSGTIVGWSTISPDYKKVYLSTDNGSTFNTVKDFSDTPDVTSIYQVGTPRSGTHISALVNTSLGRSLYVAKLSDLSNWEKTLDFNTSTVYAMNYF